MVPRIPKQLPNKIIKLIYIIAILEPKVHQKSKWAWTNYIPRILSVKSNHGVEILAQMEPGLK